MTTRTKQTLLLIIAALIVIIAVFAMVFFYPFHKDEHEKIGFIMTGEMHEQGWNGVNYDGINSVCKEFDAELLVKENIPEQTEQCSEAIKELIQDGAEMIILSSYGYTEKASETIKKHPDIVFYGINENDDIQNLNTYFGRMYQARYLSGIIAGLYTETGKIGYVASMPNNEVNRGINAFALGVRRVNPNVEVIVSWTNSWNDKQKAIESAYALIDEGVDLLTHHQNESYVLDVAEAEGIYSIGYHQPPIGYSDKCLTSSVMNWNNLYTEIVKNFHQGNKGKKKVWLGISKNVVALSEFSPLVSDEAIEETEKAKNELVNGHNIFSGEIYDNEGYLRCERDETISDYYLMNYMDWYVEGVSFYE